MISNFFEFIKSPFLEKWQQEQNVFFLVYILCAYFRRIA